MEVRRPAARVRFDSKRLARNSDSVSVSGATTLIDAAELSNALGPNAIVVCASDRAAADRLNTLLSPYGLECYGGAIRVYDQKPAIEQKKYNEPSKANILNVYDEIEKNQIFGTKEIKEILDCSPSTARAVMTKLRDMKVVKAVNGKGKGKYVFIE